MTIFETEWVKERFEMWDEMLEGKEYHSHISVSWFRASYNDN